MMQIAYIINQLETSASSIAATIQGVHIEQARWKPGPNDWSILEVVNHLLDEEQADFRFRIRETFEHPEAQLPPIDPEGWSIERRYNERDLQQSLKQFLEERQASLSWLRTLGEQDWSKKLNHPHLHELSTGDLLYAWAAHDLLHIRQINELRYFYTKQQAGDYQIRYAGDW